MRTPLLTLTLTLALSLPGLASADIVKCITPDGMIVYQNTACMGTQTPMVPDKAPGPTVPVTERASMPPAPSIPPMWLFREYRSADLPGVTLEGVTTRSFGVQGHSIEGTLRNGSTRPLRWIKLTFVWQYYGTISDTSLTYAVSDEPLLPGMATRFQAFTSANANDYYVRLLMPDALSPITFTPERR